VGKKQAVKVKLMGYTQNSSDIRGVRHIKTASSIFLTKEEQESLQSAMDFRALAVDRRREIDKFAHQDAAVERFRESYFKARKRLAAKINKNRALMELRHNLQKERRHGGGEVLDPPDPQAGTIKESKPSITQGDFNEVELRY